MQEIRDHVKRHILALERNLADFETDLRRSRLREKMMTHARAMGAKSLAAMRDASDSLGLRDDARPVPDRTDLSSPARFHGVFADSRVMECVAHSMGGEAYRISYLDCARACVCVCV